MKQGLFLFFAFCAISNAYAQMDCESIPSCAELGYTQASCPEGSASLKCPFDETKFYCIGSKKLADAPAPVITPEDWTVACADTIAHCTTLDSDCRCTACESDYNLANNGCVSKCTGTNKCKDASGNCITCYASCSAYNSSYKDSQPSGQSCSTKDVMIGAGNGATATSKTCYYNCSTIDTCTGTNKCKDSSGNCITCYASCAAYNSSYKDSQPSGQSCSTKDVMIGAGNGATATSKTCYYNCSTIDTCTGTNKCKDASGNCITCYASCSAAGYKFSEPDGYSCSTTSVWIGSGNGATATKQYCYYNCSKIDTCTGSGQCKDSSGNCITCYASCSVYDSSYTSTDDKKQDGYSCSSKSVWIGSGNGATATSETCYKCTCGGAGKCLYSGKCVDCYYGCSSWDSSYLGYEASGQATCSTATIYTGSGYGGEAKLTTCYKCTCESANQCKDTSGNCVTCYSSCSAYDSSYREDKLGDNWYCHTMLPIWVGSGYGATATYKTCYKCSCDKYGQCMYKGTCVHCYEGCSYANSSYKDSQPSGYTCSSTSVYIGSGYGATASSKTCYYNCTCNGAHQCKTSLGDCVDCYSSCKAAGYSGTGCPSATVMCGLIYIGSGNGSTVTGEEECYLKQ